jgi:predicted nucleic acid-binding protein
VSSVHLADERDLVLFDASVLVAASRSPYGGSAAAAGICQGSRFRAVVTDKLLVEARTNIAEKFGDDELVRFYRQIAALDPVMAKPPSAYSLDRCGPLAIDEDGHVVAAALEAGAAYLLTLDRGHLLTPVVTAANLPFRTLTPGEFLQGLIGRN